MIRLGIVGCGDVAFRNYLPSLGALAGRARLVAVCDAVEARAHRAATEYGATSAYTDLG